MTEARLDKLRARRAFHQAADGYDDVAVLQQEMGQRMLQRLQLVRLQPQRILDLGSGTAALAPQLMKQYPRAQLFALDFAEAMLHQARKRGRWRKRPLCVCADMDSLPFADESFDLLWSNAAIQWSGDAQTLMAEIKRILKPGGLFHFSTFGPMTLWELREAWAQVDQQPHVHEFIDMHDLGDLMLHQGLAEPVLDVERMCLTYKDSAALMRDLKALGAHNASHDQARGLTGRQQFRQLQAAYEGYRRQGVLPASYEVVYGHVWKAEQKSSRAGQVEISLPQIKRL
ncbi:MAG: malonyl-ACP O-methyltransferase BioC [gamma proteobacterium symbiont of Bathyaustriella thionipta]|nr:malonyl-ACP O-methyltransferase BioC [gamma proteobacterium symbiont of Bathyaustriella thionipta]